MIKAVVFDMDGTMVDNMMVHHRAWQRTLEKYGLKMTLEQVHQEVHGVNLEILERLFRNTYTFEERVQISREKEEIYRAEFRDKLQLLTGLDEFMKVIQRRELAMGVASAAPPENVDFILDSLGIRSLFQSILHAEDVIHGKPNPEIYLKSAAELGVAPTECLVFEDSPTGARAAAAAECLVIVVTTTHQPSEFSGIEGIVDFIQDFSDEKLGEIIR